MAPFDFVLAGRYKLVAPLGEGGMAAVYRARDLRLNREVAVKVLRTELNHDAEFLRRFQREAQIVASLSHRNIVPVYDVGEEQGSHFIVMELVRGRTLKEELARNGPMRPEEAIPLMQSVLDALGHAHERGLVHRDVKPQNILMAADGTPRLTDFGIAHLVEGSSTRTAAILGSAHYLSPEQARGGDATVQSDIYACGIVLYEMLDGHPPFDGSNALAVASQHVNASPAPLSADVEIPQALERAVMRALEKDPEDRFVDTVEFAATLAGTVTSGGATEVFQPVVEQTQRLAPEPVPASRPEPRDAALLLRRSSRKTAALAFLCGLGLAVAGEVAAHGIGGRTLPEYPSAPYALLPAFLAVVLFISWLTNRSWSYRMDGNAAVVQWGLVGHHRFGVPVRYITTLELKQSPIDRLLGVGTVEVCARDQHGVERRLVMEDVPRPSEAYDDLVRFVGRATRGIPVAHEE